TGVDFGEFGSIGRRCKKRGHSTGRARLRAVSECTTLALVSQLDYIHVTYPEPHAQRARQMLAAHPELRDLAGPAPSTALWVLALVAVQLGLALLVGGSHWLIWVPTAYIVGATIDHALWALIHDACHNLVFRWRSGNRVVAILANL